MPETEDYDALSYGDLTFHDSHPAHIAAIGSLAGLAPPPVESCRVLELGCGTGFNLLAMSQSIPGGRFLGIDLSAAHIDRARNAAAATGANNVEFRCLSIDDFSEAPGSFDYIVAHGVYSWVPAATREAMLAIVERHLAPDGLAYISYNANPGWRLRSLVRDGLRFCTDPSDAAGTQVPRARERLETLTQSLIAPDTIYARALLAEWDEVRATPDYYVAHEYLAPENTAFFFEEFVRNAARHNLQFAAEARFVSNCFTQSESTQAHLEAAAGGDVLRREQYLDFLVGRYFRQTLLCHAGHSLDRDPAPQLLLQLHVALTAEILERNPASLRVRQIWGKELDIGDAACMRILEQLDGGGAWPVPARALEGAVLEALGMRGMEGHADPVVAAVLWSGWRNGLWTMRAGVPAMTPAVSARPRACPLARYQASLGAECTNRLHRPVPLTAEERRILCLLDGTHTAAGADRTLARFAALGLLVS